jgi:exoribonuclease R
MKNKYVLFRYVSWSGHQQGQGGTTHPIGNESQGGSEASLRNALVSQETVAGEPTKEVHRSFGTSPGGSHPHGQLTEVIGDVDQLESFYEYQLYSKSLHSSIKDITDRTRKQLISPGSIDVAIQSILQNPVYGIEDRTHLHVFTIDPPNSLDYDDGFSIRCDPESGRTIVTVYIANVFVWLEHFQLWESFSNRVATIYLPDRFRRPMLPTILSDTLCSLQKGHIRFALAMDFEVDVATSSITPLKSELGPKMVAIRPTANYAYESPELFRDADYQRLKCATPGAPKNSHNLVTWWMIHTNSYVAEYMKTVRRAGIFRIGTVASTSSETSIETSNTTVPESNTIPEQDSAIDSSLELLSEDAARVVLHWKHMMGQYVAFQDGIDASQFCGGREAKPPDPTHSLRHVWLNRSAYMHMTSPIRRLVDLLNQMILFESVLSPAAKTFVKTWMGKLDYINTTMRSIRKVESTCQLISLCTNRPDVLEASHQGIVFDKTSNTTTTIDDTSSVYNYMVYLEDLRMLVRMPRSNRSVANHSRHMFRLFLFETEYSTKKKIRIGFA